MLEVFSKKNKWLKVATSASKTLNSLEFVHIHIHIKTPNKVTLNQIQEQGSWTTTKIIFLFQTQLITPLMDGEGFKCSCRVCCFSCTNKILTCNTHSYYLKKCFFFGQNFHRCIGRLSKILKTLDVVLLVQICLILAIVVCTNWYW